MADILDLIKSRRNIKHYSSKFVAWEDISKVLDAARHAPSSGNIQNWKFIVVMEPEAKHNLARACYEQYDIAMAGCLIVVVAETDKAERYYGIRGERLYSVQNCAAAIQNMLLEAHSLGLGTTWIGAFDEEEVKACCSIPEQIRPQAVIALGYAKDVPPRPPKFPMESLVFFSQWRRRLRDPAKYSNEIATILARKADNMKEKVKVAGKFVVDKAKEKISK